MPINENVESTEFALVGGLHKHIDPKRMPDGAMEVATNVIHTPAGSLQKRPGDSAVVSNALITDPVQASVVDRYGVFASRDGGETNLACTSRLTVTGGEDAVVLPRNEVVLAASADPGWGDMGSASTEGRRWLPVQVADVLAEVEAATTSLWVEGWSLTSRYYFIVTQTEVVAGTYERELLIVDRNTSSVVERVDVHALDGGTWADKVRPVGVIAGENSATDTHYVTLVGHISSSLNAITGTIVEGSAALAWGSKVLLDTLPAAAARWDAYDLRDDKSPSAVNKEPLGVVVYPNDPGSGVFRLRVKTYTLAGWSGFLETDTNVARTSVDSLCTHIIEDEAGSAGEKRVAYWDAPASTFRAMRLSESSPTQWQLDDDASIGAEGTWIGAGGNAPEIIVGARCYNQAGAVEYAIAFVNSSGRLVFLRGAALATETHTFDYYPTTRAWPAKLCGMGATKPQRPIAVFSQVSATYTGGVVDTHYVLGDCQGETSYIRFLDESATKTAPGLTRNRLAQSYQIADNGDRGAVHLDRLFDRTTPVASITNLSTRVEVLRVVQWRFGGLVPRMQSTRYVVAGGGNPTRVAREQIIPLHVPSPRLNVSVTAGGSASVGTYGVAVVANRRTSDGTLIRSRPVIDAVTLTGGNQTINVTVTAIPWEQNASEIWYELYLTLTNLSVFYFYSMHPGSQTLSWVINTSPTAEGGLMYTAGGVLSAALAPLTAGFARTGSRLFLLDALRPDRVWISKAQVKGVSWEWPQGLVVVFPERLTGIVAMDGRLVGFSSSAAYVLSGAGPPVTGGGGFAPIERLGDVEEAGCTDPESILEAPGGVYFRNSRGYFFMSRGLQVTQVGLPVVGLEQDTIRSILVSRGLQREARFYHAAGVLVHRYSEESQGWYSWSDQVTDVTNGAAITKLRDYGVMDESLSSYEDGGVTDYQLDVLTGWINTKRVTGFFRMLWMYVLGTWQSTHSLQVDVYYDYSDSIMDTYTFAATTDPGNMLFRIKPSRQKCTAFRLRIRDTDRGGSYASVQLHAVGIEFARRPKTTLASSKTVEGE